MDFRHLAVILLAVAAYYFYGRTKRSLSLPGTAIFDSEQKLLTLTKKGRTLLTADVGQNYDLSGDWTECKADMVNGQAVCGFWEGQAQLQLGTYSDEGRCEPRSWRRGVGWCGIACELTFLGCVFKSVDKNKKPSEVFGVMIPIWEIYSVT